jgi:hypothetical protein
LRKWGEKLAGNETTIRIGIARRYYLLVLAFVFCAGGNQNAFALTASIGPNGCNAQAVHALGFTGQDVSVGIISQAHCRVSHEAFFDKDSLGNPVGTSYAHWFDATGDTLSPYEPFYHDTAMSGIVGSRGGRLWPAEIGVAPDAKIYSVKVTKAVSATDPNRLISSTWVQAGLDELNNNGCRVAVTGLQFLLTDYTPNGSSVYSLMYDYYANTYDMIFINAAGNDATSVTVFGDGYNGITTAGLRTTNPDVYRQVGTASNPGPTADSRRKPDIAAPAQNLRVPMASSDTAWAVMGTTRGETSWAGPHAAGVAALLVQYANGSAEAYDEKSVVIKAVMVNTTFPNIRSKTGIETTGQLWHAQRGYGRVDALRAYNVLSQPKVTAGTDITQSAGWAYKSISSLGQNTYRIYGYKNERLTTTLTWHRKVEKNGSIYSDELAPKLNLNLSISDPNGNIIFSESGAPNNLRKADVLLPKDGFYEVRVTNTTTKNNRYYGLAFELLEPLEGDFNTNYVVDTSDLTLLAEYWLADNCTDTAQDCYGLDTDASGKIDLAEMAALSEGWLTSDPRYYTP